MKKTITILIAGLMMVGFASCMEAAGNENRNPIAVGIYSFREQI